MNLASIKNLLKLEKIDFFKEEHSYHFHMIQLLTFFYLVYRLISRDYAYYSFLTPEELVFPRGANTAIWTSPAKYTTFNFIYDYISIPSYAFFKNLQGITVIAGIFGLLGIFPRFMALIGFMFMAHMTGFVNATNAEVESGTLLMVGLLTLFLSGKTSVYSWKNRIFTSKKSSEFNWPTKIFLIFVAGFYTTAGINKIFDEGPQWFFMLNLENLAMGCQLHSISFSSRFSWPYFCQFFTSPILSDISGLITLIGEIGFFYVIFKPKSSWFFVPCMITLHVFVFLMAGINFLGSTLVLIGCMNWNDIFLFFKGSKTNHVES